MLDAPISLPPLGPLMTVAVSFDSELFAWVLAQKEIRIRRAHITWRDEMPRASADRATVATTVAVAVAAAAATTTVPAANPVPAATDAASAAPSEASIAVAPELALSNVDLALSTLPQAPPPGRFDLIMLSEVLYYFDRDGVRDMAATVVRMARDDADIMLVHWLGPTPDYPLDGETAVRAFLAAIAAKVTVIRQTRTPDYRLDVLRVRAA